MSHVLLALPLTAGAVLNPINYRGIMNVFCVGLVISAILQAVMWLPANGNVPVSFVFAFLYGATGIGAIGELADTERDIDPRLTCDLPFNPFF